MPPNPGESTLCTVFADVYYVFSPPGLRPVHARFEKGSYVYVHHNPTTGGGRIEIANNAGTPDQDAFNGSLEYARVSFSHRRPSQMSIGVVPSAPGAQWQLPAFAPDHAKKYLYPMRELDLYFWTADDAREVLEATRKVRLVSSLQVQDAPPAERQQQQQQQQHHQGRPSINDSMSPVVQKLEQAAITTPYSHNQRVGSVGQVQSFAPPPPPQPTHSAAGSASTGAQEQSADAYKPVAAYNPAAPPPPEPIAHREKTPPPPDGPEGTGLQGAGLHEHSVPGQGYGAPQSAYQPGYGQHQSPFTQSFSPTPSGPTSFSPAPSGPTTFSPVPSSGSQFSGPPHQQSAMSRYSTHGSNTATPPQRTASGSSFPLPPPPQSLFAPTFSPPPTTQSGLGQQQQQQTAHPNPAGFSSYHHQQQASQQTPASPAFPPPPPSGAPAVNQQPAGQQQHHYSQFSYSQQPHSGSHADPHTIHSQVYRPTEQEASLSQGAAGGSSSSGNPSGLGARADRLEKGMNRFLKKMDKKFG